MFPYCCAADDSVHAPDVRDPQRGIWQHAEDCGCVNQGAKNGEKGMGFGWPAGEVAWFAVSG